MIYSGAEPIFIEEDVFKTIIPLVLNTSDQADEYIKGLLEFCKTPRSREEMQQFMKLNHRGYFRRKILNPLIKGGLLKPTIPDKPTSPNQKYYSEKR